MIPVSCFDVNIVSTTTTIVSSMNTMAPISFAFFEGGRDSAGDWFAGGVSVNGGGGGGTVGLVTSSGNGGGGGNVGGGGGGGNVGGGGGGGNVGLVGGEGGGGGTSR